MKSIKVELDQQTTAARKKTPREERDQEGDHPGEEEIEPENLLSDPRTGSGKT